MPPNSKRASPASTNGKGTKQQRGSESATPTTLVLLVRHGLTPTTGTELPGRTPGLSLSEEGQGQAAGVARRIATFHPLAAVYASPLERTRETATPIAKAAGLRVRSERGLLELDVGTWAGSKLAELQRLPEWTTVQRYPSGFRFPNGESFTEMQLRITSTLDRLVRRHTGEVVVAVSHADPIRVAAATALGMSLDLFQRIAISPCSVTAIGYTALGPVVLCVNAIDGELASLRPA